MTTFTSKLKFLGLITVSILVALWPTNALSVLNDSASDLHEQPKLGTTENDVTRYESQLEGFRERRSVLIQEMMGYNFGSPRHTRISALIKDVDKEIDYLSTDIQNLKKAPTFTKELVKSDVDDRIASINVMLNRASAE